MMKNLVNIILVILFTFCVFMTGYEIADNKIHITSHPMFIAFDHEPSGIIPTYPPNISIYRDDLQVPQELGYLTFTRLYYFPNLVYLYGKPYFEFCLPSHYFLNPDFVMPYSQENIEAGYVIGFQNKDGTGIIEIPVSPEIPNIK